MGTIVWELEGAKPSGRSPATSPAAGLRCHADGSFSRRPTRGARSSENSSELTDMAVGPYQISAAAISRPPLAFHADNSDLIIAGWEGVIRRIALPLQLTPVF